MRMSAIDAIFWGSAAVRCAAALGVPARAVIG
jgi:hypothetical protein